MALDKLEGLLDNYLVKLTDRALTAEESTRVSELLHTLSDFERIGDYAVNVSESAVVLHDRNITFSPRPGPSLRGSPRRWRDAGQDGSLLPEPPAHPGCPGGAAGGGCGSDRRHPEKPPCGAP